MSAMAFRSPRRRSLLGRLRAWTFVGVAAPMLAATLGVTLVLRYTTEQATLAQIRDQLDGAWAFVDEIHQLRLSGGLTEGEALAQVRRAFAGRASLLSFRSGGLEDLGPVLDSLGLRFPDGTFERRGDTLFRGGEPAGAFSEGRLALEGSLALEAERSFTDLPIERQYELANGPADLMVRYELSTAVSRMRDSGYVWAIVLEGAGPDGKVFEVFHPSLTMKDVSPLRNERGEPVGLNISRLAAERLPDRDVEIYRYDYAWKNPGEERDRFKTVLIRPHRGMGWALGAGLYRDEVFGLIDGLSIVVSLVGTMVALGASLLVARIGKRELFDRVARLDASLTAMASGHYQDIPADGRGDEISRITEAARALAEAVADREASLEGAAAELERRVEERSGQLLAAEREAMVGRLVAGFAHEINNPLAAIKSVVETARRETGRIAARLGGNPAGETGYQAAAARELAELASSLEALGEPVGRIGALLGTLSGLAAGKSAGGEERTALRRSIGDALALLPRAAVARASVELDLDEELSVRIDPAGARRVWLALATNALQAVDWQGRIAIRARLTGDRVSVEFEDEGPGVDPALGASIFEPFVSSRARSEGLGLGLALSRGIVAEYGGSIAFESRPGRTVFRVELEVAREP